MQQLFPEDGTLEMSAAQSFPLCLPSCGSFHADKLPVPLNVLVKFRGSVEDVRAAVEAGTEVAKKVSGVISSYVIASPDSQTEPMFKLKAFDKN